MVINQIQDKYYIKKKSIKKITIRKNILKNIL